MGKLFRRQKRFATLIAVLPLVLAATISTAAQSTDVAFPTAVLANEIDGRIMPRDIGDARLTRHFYVLTGTPGDLAVTVESRNLNGDVDLFVAGSMRPVAKITIYGGADSSTVTKSVYLRRQENLVVRVEARSLNDTEGLYRVRFDGAFAPASSDMIAQSENNRRPSPLTRGAMAGTRRVTSVGGRVEADEAGSGEAKTNDAKNNSESTSSARVSAIVADAESKQPPPSSSSSPVGETTTTPKPVVVIGSTRTRPRRPRPGPLRNESAARKTTPESKPVSPSALPPQLTNLPVINARLIVETRNGTRREREMSTVRRVTIENNQLIIVMKDGTSEMQPMANILRMAIEP